MYHECLMVVGSDTLILQVQVICCLTYLHMMSELFHNEDIGPSFSKYILENGHLYDMTETKMAPFSK